MNTDPNFDDAIQTPPPGFEEIVESMEFPSSSVISALKLILEWSNQLPEVKNLLISLIQSIGDMPENEEAMHYLKTLILSYYDDPPLDNNLLFLNTERVIWEIYVLQRIMSRFRHPSDEKVASALTEIHFFLVSMMNREKKEVLDVLVARCQLLIIEPARYRIEIDMFLMMSCIFFVVMTFHDHRIGLPALLTALGVLLTEHGYEHNYTEEIISKVSEILHDSKSNEEILKRMIEVLRAPEMLDNRIGDKGKHKFEVPKRLIEQGYGVEAEIYGVTRDIESGNSLLES